MSPTTYTINKGISRSLEFKGIKAQYIYWLGAGLVLLLILFAILSISGLSSLLCIAITFPLGGIVYLTVYRLSHKYGEHGLTKVLARRRFPKAIRVRTRQPFLQNPS